jgi:multidrug efflux pump subunit AcrA (membrane-fusion protein)
MTQEEFEQRLAALQARMKVSEYDFYSPAPVIGPLIMAIRRGWNNISARWYVQDYARQQLEFQRELVQLLQAMQQDNAQLRQQITLLENQLAEKDRRLSMAQRMLERDVTALAKLKVDQTNV